MLRRALIFFILTITCVYIYIGKTTGDESRISAGAVPPDALEYLSRASQYSPAYGAAASSKESTQHVNNSREPLYPVLLSGLLRITDSGAQSQCLETNGADCAPARLKLKLAYGVVILLCGLSAYFILLRRTRSHVLAYAGLVLVSGSQNLWLNASHLLSEPLAALILLWTSYFFYLAYNKTSSLIHLAPGVGIGLLYLTKIAFLPLLIIYPVILLVGLLSLNTRKAVLARNMAVFFVGFLIVALPWKEFSQQASQTSSISSTRGSAVLIARANYNQMTTKEYGVSFIYWASGTGKKIAETVFDYDAYANLDRKNPSGYFARGLGERVDTIESQSGSEKSSTFRHLIKEIISSPLAHLATSIPIFYRGMFVETGFDIGRSSIFGISLASSLLIGPILFFALFMLLRNSVYAKSWGIVVFLCPTIYSIVFHSLVTHNIPRYSHPLIPLLVISFLLLLYEYKKTIFLNDKH